MPRAGLFVLLDWPLRPIGKNPSVPRTSDRCPPDAHASPPSIPARGFFRAVRVPVALLAAVLWRTNSGRPILVRPAMPRSPAHQPIWSEAGGYVDQSRRRAPRNPPSARCCWPRKTGGPTRLSKRLMGRSLPKWPPPVRRNSRKPRWQHRCSNPQRAGSQLTACYLPPALNRRSMLSRIVLSASRMVWH